VQPEPTAAPAGACHQAASWLGEPVLGDFALVRKPTGQPVGAFQRIAVDKAASVS